MEGWDNGVVMIPLTLANLYFVFVFELYIYLASFCFACLIKCVFVCVFVVKPDQSDRRMSEQLF